MEAHSKRSPPLLLYNNHSTAENGFTHSYLHMMCERVLIKAEQVVTECSYTLLLPFQRFATYW